MSEREITVTLKGKNLLASDFQKAREQILGLGTASDDAGKRGTGMGGAFKTAAASFAGFLGGAAVIGGLKSAFDFAVGGAIEMNATLEKSTLQFGTLMGDTAKAESHVRSLFEFAKKTPFETGPIIEASKFLQTFGGDALNSMDNLTLLGDAAAATNAPIEDLGFWTGRLYAALKGGQPFGEAAMRLQEMAVLTPEARQQMEAMQAAGKSTEEIFAVFQGRLGEFSGAMVAQSNTWGGLTSSIKDAVNIMMADALKPMFELVKTGAQIVLQALGSDGMEAAFSALKGSVESAVGDGGGAGLVKGFISALLTGVDLGLAALGFFGQGWGALNVVVYGAATVILNTVDNVLRGFTTMVEGAAKIPGIGGQFQGLATELRGASDFVNSLKLGMVDLTKEAAQAATGNDTWGKSIGGARTIVQALRTEIENATVATNTSESSTRKAAAAKSEYTVKTKEQEKAEKEAAKAAEKFAESVTGMTRGWTELKPALTDAGAEIRNITAGLEANGTLTSRTLTETGQLRAEALAWAQANNATLAPSIKAVGKELLDTSENGRSFKSSLSAAFKDLPGVIQGALQGGGNVGKSIGASIFGNLFSADSALTKSLTGGLTNLLGSGLGSALGAAIPGIGAALGPVVGELGQKLFGKLFKSEGKQVNDMRDQFIAAAGGLHELNVKAHESGLTLDRLLKAKNVKDFQAAVEELNGAFGKTEADTELARQAMDEWGITASEAGQKFAQADMDKTANAMLAKLKAATAAGVDLSAIVSKGGDDFGKMVHQAIRSGTTISQEFKPVLAAMIEQGTLIDENGEKFTDLSQIPFATDIGAGLKGIGDSLKELADFFMGRTKDAMGEATRSGMEFGAKVRDAINGIPRTIEIDVNGRYNAPDIDGGNPGYAVGTKGRHGSYFVNFGDGTDTRLHGYEAVITPEQAPDFVAAYLRNQGTVAAPTAAAPAITVLVEMTSDGRVTNQRVISQQEALRRQMQNLLRAGAVTVPQTAVAGVA